MSDIILFYPKINSGAGLLPAGLLMIAAPLLKKGFSVKIIDQRFEDDWQEKLEYELKQKPLLVGLTVMTGKQILEALTVSKLVKEKSEAKVVWGGVHASLLPEQTLTNKYIDFIVIGEGENIFLELVERLKNGSDVSQIKGLGYKKEGKIFYSFREDFLDLNTMPVLPYHLLSNIENYISKKSITSGKPAREIVLFTSRGCPHRCGLCYNIKFNRRRWRAMNAERALMEIKFLVKEYKINSFRIQDDEFYIDPKRVAEICAEIKKENLNLEIYSSARVDQIADLMDFNFIKELKECGFGTLVFGVETGSPRILELIHKDITYDQVIKTIKRLKELKIISKYCFVAGFPTENIDDFYKTTDFIYKMKLLDISLRIPPIRVFTPYPGVPLWDLCLKEGFIPPATLREWADFDFDTVKMPWVTRKLTNKIKNVNIMLSYLRLDPGFSSGLKYKLSLLFGRWIDFRWRNHLFAFFPEKYIIRFFNVVGGD